MKKPLIVGAFKSGLYRKKSILTLFNASEILLRPKHKDADKIGLVIGWGKKPNTRTPQKYAQRHGLPYTTLEDGFIHSMSQGRLGSASWSLVTDELGIFYDASTSSALEQLILKLKLTNDEIKRANDSINTIIRYGITKYNNTKHIIPEFIQKLKDPILIVDQVAGDMSIPYALANKHSFDAMLNTAIEENPNSDILVKIHPDVINGKRKGCINLRKCPNNIYLVSDNLNPIRLIEQVEKVYVVSSQLGLEALLLKKQVICFGIPFYSGWGLTDDRADNSSDAFKRRARKASLETIFYAAYFEYSNYFHPDTQQPCQLENILEYIKLQYETRSKLASTLFCLGFTPWKKRFMTHYLKTPDNQVFFATSATHALKMGFNSHSTICLWSSRHEEEALKLTQINNNTIWRIEDGFIRSVSLGSNYAPPASLVIDKHGLYFDPNQASGLEKILSESHFDGKLLLRAGKLKQQLINQAISKYNGGDRGTTNLFDKSGTKRIILVPGQVADDESIKRGCRDISDNLALIKTVREHNPEAYLVYKPHPDVLSGNRNGHIEPVELLKYCDQVILNASITDCLSQSHEVHTMTSLVGFEALLRGLKVYCYGTPFYSNWGLTVDRHPCSRRKRTLSIDELVAGALIEYPLYMNWNTKNYTSPEVVTNAIHQHLNITTPLTPLYTGFGSRQWSKLMRKISLARTMISPKLK